MDTPSFLKMVHTPGRKLLHGNAAERHHKVLRRAYEEFGDFWESYERHFSREMSPQQQQTIAEILRTLSEMHSKENHERLLGLISEFSSFGVNYLVRHPEPLLESYARDQEASKTLTMRGTWQVRKFNAYLAHVLQAYDKASVELYYSAKYRTELFAKLTANVLQRHTSAEVVRHDPVRLDVLYQNVIKEMIARYPDVKEVVESGWSREQLKTVTKYFRAWTRDSPNAEQIAKHIHRALSHLEKNTVKIFFTHENVIAPYLHYVLGEELGKNILKHAGYIRITDGHAYTSN